MQSIRQILERTKKDRKSDRVFLKEDSRVLRLESELSDLRAANVNLRRFATASNLHITRIKKQTTTARAVVRFLVEVTGFEPAASWSRTKRATICATPRFLC